MNGVRTSFLTFQKTFKGLFVGEQRSESLNKSSITSFL